MTGLPAPKQSEACTVPSNNSIRLNNGECDMGAREKSTGPNDSRPGLPRRNTMICCLSTRTSASSAARDRKRSTTKPKNLPAVFAHPTQDRPILSRLPTGSDLRQGQAMTRVDRAIAEQTIGVIEETKWPTKGTVREYSGDARLCH
jgi:hypothetical protein